MKQREKEIEDYLTYWMKESGCLVYKFVSPGQSGVPDRIYILPVGRVIFAEIKAEGGVLSPLQKRQINKMTSMGCEVVVIRGMEGAQEFLAKLRREYIHRIEREVIT